MDGICHVNQHPPHPLLPLPLLDGGRFGRGAPAAFGTAAGRPSGPETHKCGHFTIFGIWVSKKNSKMENMEILENISKKNSKMVCFII
jgi:hypothetical protein